MNTLDTRAAFEAWAKSKGYAADDLHPLVVEAWQAATEAAKATGTAVHKLCETFGIKILEGMTPEMAIACRLKDLEDAVAQAARQPVPVAIKPWQERVRESVIGDEAIKEWWVSTVSSIGWKYMEEEITELRAALAATNRSRP